MVSFTYLFILPAALAAVSAKMPANNVNLKKRDIPPIVTQDITKIANAITELDDNIKGLVFPADQSDIDAVEQSFTDLINIVSTAAIDTEGLPRVGEQDISNLNLNDIIITVQNAVSDILAQNETIKGNPDFEEMVHQMSGSAESAIAAWVNGIIGILPLDKAEIGLEVIDALMADFGKLQATFTDAC